MADPNQRSIFLAYVAPSIGVVCIGFSAIFVKITGAPGVVSAFYRVLIAGIGIVPWGLLRQKKCPSPKKTILIAAGGVLFCFDLALWNTSLLLTSAATATLLANNAPLWVGLGALVLFREQLSFRYWCGLILSIVGMAILVAQHLARASVEEAQDNAAQRPFSLVSLDDPMVSLMPGKPFHGNLLKRRDSVLWRLRIDPLWLAAAIRESSPRSENGKPQRMQTLSLERAARVQ